MGDVISLTHHRRPASPMRIYINPPADYAPTPDGASDSPTAYLRQAQQQSARTIVNWRKMAAQTVELRAAESAAMPKPGDYLRAKAADGELTLAQARELALITRAELASDSDMKAWFLAKADQVALGVRSPMSMLTLDGDHVYRGCEVRGPRLVPCADDHGADDNAPPGLIYRTRSLIKWIVGLIGLCAVIAIWPVG